MCGADLLANYWLITTQPNCTYSTTCYVPHVCLTSNTVWQDASLAPLSVQWARGEVEIPEIVAPGEEIDM